MAEGAERQFLSTEDVGRLIDAASPKIRPAIMMMAGLGLRAGEVSQADWRHPVRRDGKWWIDLRQTKRGRRTRMPIPPGLWADLRSLRPEARDGAFRMPHVRLARLFRRAVVKAGLPDDVRPHDLRRCWARRQMLTEGVNDESPA